MIDKFGGEKSSKSWEYALKMPHARAYHGLAVVDKNIFVFGGFNRSQNGRIPIYLNSLSAFNTETQEWKRMAEMIEPR